MKAAHQPIVNAFLRSVNTARRFPRARRAAALICDCVSIRDGSASRGPVRARAKTRQAVGCTAEGSNLPVSDHAWVTDHPDTGYWWKLCECAQKPPPKTGVLGKLSGLLGNGFDRFVGSG